TVAGNLPLAAFGLAFAPQGFGSVGGRLLVGDEGGGLIDAISSNGSVATFGNIPLTPGQRGVRQMAFVPTGFGDLGGLLLVSVSGSSRGGGTLGSLLALDGSGQ